MGGGCGGEWALMGLAFVRSVILLLLGGSAALYYLHRRVEEQR